MTRTSSRTALAVVALLTLAACGDDDDDDAAVGLDGPRRPAAAATRRPPRRRPAGHEAAAAGTTAAGGSAPAAGDATVMTAENELGTILVDGEGHDALHVRPDTQGPSLCEADCLANWPSLTGPATAGEGVDAALLGTATRARRRHRAGHLQRLAAVLLRPGQRTRRRQRPRRRRRLVRARRGG